MESTHDVTLDNMETYLDTTVQLPEDDDNKSIQFQKNGKGGATPIIKGTSSSFVSPQRRPLASIGGDYVDNDSKSHQTARKINLVAGENTSFLSSLVKQHNDGMDSTKSSRIRKFGTTGKTGLSGANQSQWDGQGSIQIL